VSLSRLTYAELAEALQISHEAVRALAKRRRWPRKVGKDGKTRISVDLATIRHKRLVAGPAKAGRTQIAAIKARVAELQAALDDMRSQRDHWQAMAEKLTGGH
jgi:hypothetical protein